MKKRRTKAAAGRRPRQRSGRAVSASKLAEMGFCERWVVLERRHGRPRVARLEAARARGTEAHARFERQGRLALQAGQRRKGRCFVATMIFGDAWQAETLRDFRDTVLRRRRWGRALVYAYYRLGPRVCTALQASPAMLRLARWGVDRAARLWRWWARRAGA